jgi:hypothetical protein
VIDTTDVAALTLGWIFAQAILHFAYVLATPVSQWIMRRDYRDLMDRTSVTTGFYFHDALPDLIKCVSLLIVGYFLLRWLYFKPMKEMEETER